MIPPLSFAHFLIVGTPLVPVFGSPPSTAQVVSNIFYGKQQSHVGVIVITRPEFKIGLCSLI